MAKTKTVISHFWIFGQSLIKINCYNSIASADINMKVEPITKFDKGNKTTAIKLDDDVMSANCGVIVIFEIYG